MAMPASGCIGIITCPNAVACTSIAQAVDGNVTPPKSLLTLSTTAGKTAPHGMTEFYNYSSSHAVSITQLSCSCNACCMCNCNCLSYSPAPVTNECYYPAYAWQLFKTTTPLIAASCIQVLCNGVSIYCCAILSKSALNCSGSFALRCVDYNDCINIITEADRATTCASCGAYATITICAITDCVGTYTIGSPATAESYSGIVP